MLTIISFLFFTILVAVATYVTIRKDKIKTNDDYFLGGRSLSGIVIAGSLLLTNLSAEQLVGLNGQAFGAGMQVIAWEITSAIPLALMGLLFLPAYLKRRMTTITEFIEERYDKWTRILISILFLIAFTVIMLPSVLYSGALALFPLFNVKELLNVDTKTAIVITVWFIGIIGSIYAVFGGLKAVAISDTYNGIGLIIGGTIIPVLALSLYGDGNLLQGFNRLIVEHPEKMNAIGPSNGTVPFGTLFSGILLVNLFYWCTNQSIIQRALGAKSLAEGQKGVLFAGFLKILVPFILVLPGILAFALYGNGVIEKNDMAYPYLVTQLLPKPLAGFFGAVLFGAILSTFNSILNSASTIFCVDIYKPFFKKDIDDKKLIKVGMYFGIIMAIVCMWVAPMIANAPAGLYDFMRRFMGFFNIPLVTIIMMGFATKKPPAISAKFVMFFFMFCYWLFSFQLKVPIHFLYIQGILSVACAAIMFVWGLIVPRQVPKVKAFTPAIDMKNWKYLYPMAFASFTTVVWVYALFSKVGLLSGSSINGWVITVLYIVITVAPFFMVNMKQKKI